MPYLINDKMSRVIEEKVRRDRRFIPTSLSVDFPEISRSLLHKLVTEKLGYRKLCPRWVPKLAEDHKMKRRTSALTFLIFWSRWSSGWGVKPTEWRHTSSPANAKIKPTISSRKIMWTSWPKAPPSIRKFVKHSRNMRRGIPHPETMLLRTALFHDLQLRTIWASTVQPGPPTKRLSPLSTSGSLALVASGLIMTMMWKSSSIGGSNHRR